MDWESAVSAERVIAELEDLRRLTADEGGAWRVAFTPIWQQARMWLKEKLATLPAEVHEDAAGNLWATLAGDSADALLLGGHLDSVPGGGWLDGCLDTLAALEILRALAAQPRRTHTVRLVDWADEEGARFGKSLFGSSAFSGHLDLAEADALRDADGVSLRDALAGCGWHLDGVCEAGRERANARAYLELHIEQGPVLLSENLPLGAVTGTFGVERHALTFHGQAAHSGSTPMGMRRDAFLAAARMAPEIHRIATEHGGVCTIGSCTTSPGIVTSVVETCRITLDQRHIDAGALRTIRDSALEAAARFASEAGCSVTTERLLATPPVLFDPHLVSLCEQAIRETCGTVRRLPSGPLHDATEVAKAGIPTVMMFVQSLHGISHNKIEDTRTEHIHLAIRALARLTALALAHLSAPPPDPSHGSAE
jgi:N-carbamoyl-L-amino-acid hydrolase